MPSQVQDQARRSAPTFPRARFTMFAAVLSFGACAPGCAPPAEPPAVAGGARPGAPGSDRDGGTTGVAVTTLPTPPPAAMIMEAPGVDTRRLTEVQRTSFFQILNTEASACGKPHSLAKSIKDDATCRDSLVVGQFIADSLAGGAAVADVRERVPEVLTALVQQTIDTKGRPVFGNERAPVEVVVFADFECPHCKLEAPGLRAAVQQFRGQAKLVFKHFPLSMHVFAKEAALACEAAHLQGKFWQMHDIVFANQTELSEAKIRAFAKEIGLDMVRFEEDWHSEAVKTTVDADRKEGERLNISGTPAVFVAGRSYSPLLFNGTVEGWIEEALRR